MKKVEKEHQREKVVVFGEEVSERQSHDSDVVFGVAILFAGIVLLFNSLGVIPWSVWELFRKYWPVLLILWGVQIVLGKNSLSRFVVLIFSFVIISSLCVFVLKDQLPQFMRFIPGEFVEWSNYWEVIGK